MKRVLLSKEPQSQVQLSPTLWCVVSYDDIVFTALAESDAFNIEISAPGEYELPNHDIVIISTTKPDQSEDCITLTIEDLSFPFQIRTRLAGDHLVLTYGHKSLSDWLIEHKVPNQQRDRMWVLAKANNVLWIPAMNYRVTQPAPHSLYVQLKERRYETTP
jgi:tRNA(Ile)-lysidine synthase